MNADLYQRISATRSLLLMVGLWPYYQSKFTQIQRLLIFSILSSFIAFQFTTVVTAECTPYFMIKLFSSVLIFIVCLLMYSSFWFHISNVKYILEKIQYICYYLKDENEISIINKYASSAERNSTRIILVGIIFLVLVHPMWPHLLERFLLINDTTSYRTMLIATEYFIDQEKYLYFIMLHMYAACCICVISTAGTGTIFVICFKHACGMLQIASYRIRLAMQTDNRQKIKQSCQFINQRITMYKGILFAIDIHRETLNFCEFISSAFKFTICFSAILGVICLSFNMFQVFQVVTFGGKVEEFFLHLACIIPILVYMFIINYLGQEITDHNDNVFLSTYNVCWYIAPLSIQKLILLLLQRGNKPYTLSAAGL
ncbi:uncharacterized protein LOC116852022 [Odontomachus brunneus]|uniref:uncharacterized protein LOC116852022 n=1 Tax=Odontomachus brunneus TaxID=486640 RepID=UPI0013F24918|nr:uncharacterized protein LOC116852022 [Odontomachus brunneus]